MDTCAVGFCIGCLGVNRQVYIGTNLLPEGGQELPGGGVVDGVDEEEGIGLPDSQLAHGGELV